MPSQRRWMTEKGTLSVARSGETANKALSWPCARNCSESSWTYAAEWAAIWFKGCPQPTWRIFIVVHLGAFAVQADSVRRRGSAGRALHKGRLRPTLPSEEVIIPEIPARIPGPFHYRERQAKALGAAGPPLWFLWHERPAIVGEVLCAGRTRVNGSALALKQSHAMLSSRRPGCV